MSSSEAEIESITISRETVRKAVADYIAARFSFRDGYKLAVELVSYGGATIRLQPEEPEPMAIPATPEPEVTTDGP